MSESNLHFNNVIMEAEAQQQIKRAKAKEYLNKSCLKETVEQKKAKLKKAKHTVSRNRSMENGLERQTRLENVKSYMNRKRSLETDLERQTMLEKNRQYMKRRRQNAKTQSILEKENLAETVVNVVDQEQYLKEFDVVKNVCLHKQPWAKANVKKFAKSTQYCICQCYVCKEAWPLKSKPKSPHSYMCSRCSRDKKSPKKFSDQNSMLPLCVPQELKNLTQVEEMLIARALPIMRVYIKPGGQRGYSGHCINLPQNVTELAKYLPRYPKNIAVIIVKVKGKENTFKDVNVRKQKVHDALLWLIQHNPHYSEVTINEVALNSLPENNIPKDLLTLETEDEILSQDSVMPDVGPPTSNPLEDRVYDESTELSSFLPVCEQQEQELEAVRNQLSDNEPMPWPTIENDPINEYQISHLATMAFPTLFFDGKGDPTNLALLRDVHLQERVKHLLKYAEVINDKWVYRFASHPRFSYWAFNMIQRKRILQQS